MYAVEITDTPSGVTEMHSKRFETILADSWNSR